MSGKLPSPSGHEASIKQRLLDLAHQRHEQFQNVLIHYALERFLYRLGGSPYAGQFVLKGAMLFALWTGEPHRATKDLDLLGYGSSDLGDITSIFRAICEESGAEEDALTFVPESVRAVRIKEAQQYEGVRVALKAYLGKALINVQVDIGFGDAVTPAPQGYDYPSLLAIAAPRVMAYPRETVIAEKYQALVALGMANSRIKDFYDLWVLSRQFDYAGADLATAIAATFQRRQTPLPQAVPLALTPTFCANTDKQRLWQAFMRKGQLQDAPSILVDVGAALSHFLLPPTEALLTGTAFSGRWLSGRGWGAP